MDPFDKTPNSNIIEMKNVTDLISKNYITKNKNKKIVQDPSHSKLTIFPVNKQNHIGKTNCEKPFAYLVNKMKIIIEKIGHQSITLEDKKNINYFHYLIKKGVFDFVDYVII